MSDEEDAYLIDFQAGDSVDLMAMVPGNLGSGVVVSNDNSHPARVLVQPAGGPGQPAPVLVERRHLRAGGDQVMVLVGRSRDSDCYLAESGGALCWNPALAGQTTNKPNYGVLMVGNGELRVRASINIPVSLTCAKPADFSDGEPTKEQLNLVFDGEEEPISWTKMQVLSQDDIDMDGEECEWSDRLQCDVPPGWPGLARNWPEPLTEHLHSAHPSLLHVARPGDVLLHANDYEGNEEWLLFRDRRVVLGE